MTEVSIEIAEGTLSGGFIPWLKEKYPFSQLTNAEWTNAEKTALRGPSFVISKEDHPPRVLAAGRKRLKHCVFVSRKVNEQGDVRVWLHPDSPLPSQRPDEGVGGMQPQAKPARKAKLPSGTSGAPAVANVPV